MSSIGLLLAAIMSLTNVLTDVARKHALDKRDLIPATFWIRAAVTAVFAAALGMRLMAGSAVEIRDGGPLFGIATLHLAPVPTFLVYWAVDVGLITWVLWLYFRALQISPLSMCLPFLAFTPVFLIPTGFILLGETTSPGKSLGVILVVAGSLVMHRRLFDQGWIAPVKAVVRERGSRYMLIVAFVFALTNPLEKKLVVMSDVFTEAFAYGLGLTLMFFLLGRAMKADFAAALRSNAGWVSLAGLLDAASLLFQLASYTFISVVITVSIKRAGIVLSVVAGWLFFSERGITDKLIAASVMFCGVLILYLPLTFSQAVGLSALAVVGMSIGLYSTRNRTAAGVSVEAGPVGELSDARRN